MVSRPGGLVAGQSWIIGVLVVHQRDPEALRAGRIYLDLVLLFFALLLIAQAADSLDLGQVRAARAASVDRDLILGLLLATAALTCLRAGGGDTEEPVGSWSLGHLLAGGRGSVSAAAGQVYWLSAN